MEGNNQLKMVNIQKKTSKRSVRNNKFKNVRNYVSTIIGELILGRNYKNV